MIIDNIDFTPRYYIGANGPRVMSKDEYDFFASVLGENTWSKPLSEAWTYINQLTIYCERFNNQMPVEIRKDLLRKLK